MNERNDNKNNFYSFPNQYIFVDQFALNLVQRFFSPKFLRQNESKTAASYPGWGKP